MSTSVLYHAQGIRGYEHVSFSYRESIVVEKIRRKSKVVRYAEENMLQPISVAPA